MLGTVFSAVSAFEVALEDLNRMLDAGMHDVCSVVDTDVPDCPAGAKLADLTGKWIFESLEPRAGQLWGEE